MWLSRESFSTGQQYGFLLVIAAILEKFVEGLCARVAGQGVQAVVSRSFYVVMCS